MPARQAYECSYGPLISGTITGVLTIAALFAAVILAAGCPARAATARDSKFQPNLEATVRYLQNSQKENGGFSELGSEPGSDFTAWVALALAAAGINPRDQTTAKQHWVGGHSAYTYLAEHAHQASLTTDFERELLVVDAAGTSSHDFGGVDLVDEILGRQIATGGNTGAFPHEAGSHTPGVNDTVFAILALSPVHEPAVEEALTRAVKWLEGQQKCDGSWNWSYEARAKPCNLQERQLLPGEEGGEVDMTGAALEALNVAKHPDPEGQERAFAYLREVENLDGGFPEFLAQGKEKAEESNVASTAWAVQAMWSAGINPENWIPRGATNEPLGYLASLQQEDGHIRYKAGEELNGMWMTAYVTPAFTGNPLPIPEVPYDALPVLSPEEPANGDGGVSTKSGGGVIVGGGGKGARLFSRPQSHSQGHTPGGVRLLGKKHAKESDTRKLNPGQARKAPTPTPAIHNKPTLKVEKKHVRRGRRSSLRPGHDKGDGAGAREPVVKGILLGNASNASYEKPLEPGAPGLRSAGAGSNETPWLAIGIAVAVLLSMLIGAQLERRRPEATP